MATKSVVSLIRNLGRPDRKGGLPVRFLHSESIVSDARRIHMPVRTTTENLHTNPERVDAENPHRDSTSDQVRAHLPPLGQWKVMNVAPFYHGAHSFSLPCVSWLNKSLLVDGLE